MSRNSSGNSGNGHINVLEVLTPVCGPGFVGALNEFLSTNCFDPEQAAVRLVRILEKTTVHDWIKQRLWADTSLTPLAKVICQTLSLSEFLTSILERDPTLLTGFTSERDFAFSTSMEIYDREIVQHLSTISPQSPFKTGLARFKLHEVFRIAVRDICLNISIEKLSRELSDVADKVVQAAYEKIYADLIQVMGAPLLPDGNFAEACILCLGKHGSRELNFSSDLDLLIFFEGEGETRVDNREVYHHNWLGVHPNAAYGQSNITSRRSRPVSFEAFFSELATRLIEMLNEPGELGFVYRVDLRLRPEGATGPLVRPVSCAVTYYQNWGQRWEKQAMLRARHCGGNPALSDHFLASIEDCIFCKYVDSLEVEETLREMRELRIRSIRNAGATPQMRRCNIKNGPGGIRDIEFMVQAVQILYGGQFPELRRGSVFEILRRIHQSGLMNAQDFGILSDGYQFLRRLEHRVQMDDMQRYHLPPVQSLDTPPSEHTPHNNLDCLASSLGYVRGVDLFDQFIEKTDQIHGLFKIVFRVDDQQLQLADLLEIKTLDEKWHETIRAYGLENPETVFRSLERLTQDPDAPHLNSKLKRLLKAILPRIFEIIRHTPNPNLAWQTFESVSLNTPARVTLYALANDNPQMLDMLLTIGSCSPELQQQIATYPIITDDLCNGNALENDLSPDEICYQFAEDSETGEPERLDHEKLVFFVTRKRFLTAGKFSLGLVPVTTAVRELSYLADFFLKQTISSVWSKRIQGLVIYGLGKYGGRELGFHSDLDLVVFYDQSVFNDATEPEKLTSEVIRNLRQITLTGKVFDVDFRLRPYGRNGPLVLGQEALGNYLASQAENWERLAWSRRRRITPRNEFSDQIDSELDRFVYGEGLSSERLQEILKIRQRIAEEKNRQHLKSAPGGLIDVEFLAQITQLKLPLDQVELRSPNTLTMISNALTANLLDKQSVVRLTEAYQFLREIENRLSLMGLDSSLGIPEDTPSREHLFRWLNLAYSRQGKPELFQSEQEMVRYVEKVQQQIHKTWKEKTEEFQKA